MSKGRELADLIRRMLLDPQNGWLCPLAAALAGMTPEQAAWAPAPGINSAWALLHHIRVEAEVVALRLRGEEADYAALGAPDGWPPPDAPVDAESWPRACQRALDAHEALAALLESLSDEALAEPVRAGWPSRRYWVQGLIVHTQHHTGQILLLRRLQGSWEPLQWLEPQG